MPQTSKNTTACAGVRRQRSRVVRLPAIFGIAQVAELRKQFDEVLNGDRPLAIDGCAVEQVDGAALQLLLAFHRAAASRAVVTHWRKPSSRLNEAAALLGLDCALGLTPAAPDSAHMNRGT